MAKLTERQKKFCKEYVIDLNATRAAISAGYSEKGAGEQGYKLLGKTQIQKEIAKIGRPIKEELESRFNITKERVLEEIARNAFLDPRRLYDNNGNIRPITDLDEDVARAISGVEVQSDQMGAVTKKIKVNDKSKNLEMLAKYLRLFTEKIEVTKGVQVIHDDL